MRNFLRSAACVTLILVCLSGCGKTEGDMPVMTTETTTIPFSTDSSTAESETAATTAPNEANTRHLFQQLDDNVQVDAEVILPEKKHIAPIPSNGGLRPGSAFRYIQPGGIRQLHD